ncbi:MAG: (Fe-S)-binding protein [Myxococcaceae bacterium]
MSADFDQHRQAYAYCAYCPKVCRFACPVSEVTRNETTSTWGKMSEAFLVTQAKRPLDEGGAAALYACTGCMRCRTFCAHQNEVGFALFTARAAAIDAGLAPRGALSSLQTFRQHGNPFGEDLAGLAARYRADSPVRYQLFPGCTALAKAPGLIDDALAVCDALSAPAGVCKASSRCCGYPLYAAGDVDGFVAHASRIAELLKPYPELMVLDPGCAYTFKVVYPRFGIELSTEVKTIYEVLAAHLEHAPQTAPLELPSAYHDACKLGRGLGQYDQPRRLLAAAVGGFREAFEAQTEAGCSGGGGLLPRTMPDASVEIAKAQGHRLAPGGETIVTACPTSRRTFERAGRRSEDLLSVLRRWLRPRQA